MYLHNQISFDYGGKNGRDVGLAWKCHMSNIMPDSIFYDGMGRGISRCLFGLFSRVITIVFLSIEEMDSVLSL